MTKLCLIVATDLNGVIGVEDKIPWRIKEDFEWFKRITMGSMLIMGRKTYESIGKPLPGRKTIVVTRNPNFKVDHPDVTVAHSYPEALGLSILSTSEYTFICGGGEIYREAMTHDNIERIFHSVVDMEIIGSPKNVYCHLTENYLKDFKLVHTLNHSTLEQPFEIRTYFKCEVDHQ